MKLRNILFVLLVVMESQCGLIDNMYDRVKNTTTGLKQDVTNVFSYGKRLVGLEKESDNRKLEEQKPGFIGGMIQFTRRKLHSVRDYFWNNNELSEVKGLFGNMYNRVKSRVLKIKGSLLNENKDGQITYNESEDAKLVRETMNKIFFNNGTRQLHGKAFQDVIDNLRKKLREIHNTVTDNPSNPVHHGEGLIDVRTFPINVNNTENNNTNNIGVNNDDNVNVEDNLLKVNNIDTEAYNDINDGIGTVVRVIKDNIIDGKDVLEKVVNASEKDLQKLKKN